MSHSSVKDSLVKNPAGPFFICPRLAVLRKRGDEQEDDQQDEPEDKDEEELEDSREDGLFGQEEELRKPEMTRPELYQRVLRKNKCESTGSRTTLSGVGVLSVLRKE